MLKIGITDTRGYLVATVQPVTVLSIKRENRLVFDRVGIERGTKAIGVFIGVIHAFIEGLVRDREVVTDPVDNVEVQRFNVGFQEVFGPHKDLITFQLGCAGVFQLPSRVHIRVRR